MTVVAPEGFIFVVLQLAGLQVGVVWRLLLTAWVCTFVQLVRGVDLGVLLEVSWQKDFPLKLQLRWLGPQDVTDAGLGGSYW